jgi:PPM family protein phosphatase
MTISQPAPDEQIAIGAATHEGQRPNQEDAYGTSTFRTADGREALLALVADGIGGHQTGERASYLAKTVVVEELVASAPASSEIPGAMARAFQQANQRIYDEAGTDPSRAGMGTTCTAVAIIENRLYLAHVGDSRAYLARGNALHQLSIDHTWAQEALAAGRSPEEIRVHPNRGVIKRYLGIDLTMETDTRYRPWGAPDESSAVDSATHAVELQTGDCLLLCTDGVHDVLGDADILVALRRYPAPVAAQRLVDHALKAGAQDNVTALVLDLPGAVKRSGAPLWVYPVIAAGVIIALGVGVTVARGGRGRTAMVPTEVAVVAEAATPGGTGAAASGGGEDPTATPTALLTATALPPDDNAPAMGSTSTLVSTATPVPTQTPVPTRTPTPTHTATPTPTSTRTLLPAPVLEAPKDGESVGETAELRWSLDPGLPEGYVYHLSVWVRGNPPDVKLDIRVAKAPYRWPVEQDGEYDWKVAVERLLDEGQWGVESAESRTGWFRREEPSGDGGSGGGGVATPSSKK